MMSWVTTLTGLPTVGEGSLASFSAYFANLRVDLG